MHMKVLHCIASTAKADPTRLAIVGLRRSVNYSDLYDDVVRLAVRLDAVAPAVARVVTMLDLDEDLVISALAVMGTGKVFVPIDPLLPSGRILALLRLVEPEVIVTSGQWLDKIREILCQLDQGDIPIVDVTSTDHSSVLFKPEKDLKGGYIYFTSGSTGTPKAVLGKISSLLHFINWESHYLGVRPTDRVSLITPQMFDPFLRDILLPLCNGAILCIPDHSLIYSPTRLLDWFDRNRITITHMIPSLLQVLLEQREAGKGLRHLRHAVLAGEMLRGGLVQMFYDLSLPDAGIVNLYGPTETTLAKMAYRVTAKDALRAIVPVGWPIDDTSVAVIGADGIPVGPGVTGEVVITTDYMSAGYLNGLDDDRQRFSQGTTGLRRPSYRTGDLGRWTTDGVLELLGRADFQIKIDGHRIELGEIEATLERYPDIRQAVVLGIEHNAGQFGLVAFLRTVSSRRLDLEALRENLEQRLPPAMIPGQFRCLDAFPKLANGKLDRRALEASILQRDESLGEYVPPTDVEARKIADIWADYLKVDRIGLQDSFFALGGTSLQAIRMLTMVCERTGIDLSFSDFFRNPRIADLIKRRGSNAFNAVQESNQTIMLSSQQGPATLEQQRIYWVQSLGTEPCLFNMAYIAQWDGPLQPELLRLAAQRLINRHPALRTTFHLVGTELVARVQTDTRVHFSCQRSDAGPDWITAHAAVPFVLEQAPLFRVDVAQQAVDRFQLLLSLHHIVGDAWSVDMLWCDLVTEYRRLIASDDDADTEKELSDHAVFDIFAFANQQRWQLADRSFDRLRKYWRGLLSEPLPMLQLPYDYQPATVHIGRGKRLGFSLTLDLSVALRQVSLQYGTTPYMTFLTIFAAFLHRYSQQEDLIIGTPVTNRPTRELHGVVGFFVNILVVRLAIEPKHSFGELLDYIQNYVLEALEKGPMPFDQLVEDLNPPRSIGVSPLFQVMFAYQDTRPAPQRIGIATLASPRQVDTGCSKYELTLEIVNEGTVFSGVFEYSLDRFEPATIERMCQNFQVFAQAIVKDLSGPIGQLALLSPAERKLIAAWNATETPFSDGMAIQQLIEAQADRTPDGIAVQFEDQAMTYRVLDAAANRLAHFLIQSGAGPGVAVGLCLDRSLDLLIGFLAILKSGGIYVPVDPEYPDSRVRLMIEDAEVKLLVTQKRNQAIGADFGLDIILIDDDAPQIMAQSAVRPPCSVGSDAIAYIIYTSGSTGRPKGVLVPHRGVCNLAEAEVKLLDMAAGCRVLQFASFSFDTSIWEIVVTLCAGGTLIMASSRDLMPGPELLDTVRKQRVTHLTLPPSALAIMPYADLPDLKVLITAGEACGVELVRRWGRGRRFFNSYGPTEATVSASNAELFVDAPCVHIGRALSNAQIWLLDGQGQIVPIGVAGELYIGGVGVTAGYQRHPNLTAERFVPDPFSAQADARLYRTGDLARYLPDGNIDYLGRIDQQIKLRGFRVELGEIESAIRSFSGVIIDAVAMVRADYLDASAAVAYILVATPDAIDINALQVHLRAQVPDFMVPAHFEIMLQFPRLPNGKVDRNGFPAPRRVVADDSLGDKAAVNEVERSIASVWARLLGLPFIDRERSFFEMGGHSLLAAHSVSLLAAECNLDLRVQDIFIGRSVVGVAARVHRHQRAGITVATGATIAPLSFAQQRMWFLQQSDPDASHYNIAVTRCFHDVSPKKLQDAWSLLLTRHPVLNARITIQDGRLCQSINDLPLQVGSYLLKEKGGETFQQQLDALAGLEARTPFDLTGPLYRLQIVRGEDGQSGFVFVVHHLLVDDTSLVILNSDLDALLGDATLLPASAASYLDFAVWERDVRQGPAYELQLDYWRGVFSSLPPVLTLPTDMLATTGDHRGAVISFQVDTDTSQMLHALAKQQGITLFVVMLAAYQVLLYRYSGERDLCIGVPVSVRELPQWHSLVGLFLNTVAVRHVVDPEASFIENLESLKYDWGAALDYCQVPFDRVVAAVDPQRDSGEQSLFRTMLVYRQGEFIRTNGMHSVANGTAKFDLTCFIDDSGDSMCCAFEYRTGLFHAETIQRLCAHFVRLLEIIARDPKSALYALPFLSEDERCSVLERGIGPDMAVPAGTVIDWIQVQIDSNPDAVAIVDADEVLTYAALGRRAESLADQMRVLGIGKGDRVALILPRSVQWIVSILGVLKLGAAYVPIDPAYPSGRIEYILRDCASRVVIGPKGVVISTTDAERSTIAGADGPAYVIYTSGSTGQPKGVVVSHAALANYVAHAARCYGGHGDVPMHTSVSFDATITSLFVPLVRGQTIRVVHEEDEVDHLAALLCGLIRLDMVKITPAHMELLSRILPPSAAGNINTLVVGGEALHSSAIDFWRMHAPQARIINEYGPTEGTVGCCIFDVTAGEAPSQGDIPIGRAIANTRLYVLDEFLQLVPVGVVGELYIGGAGVADGYLNKPELTAQRFVPDPYSDHEGARMYRTGDLVKHGVDGQMLFIGRRDEQIKLRGYRIELGEIEAALNDQPEVEEAVVILVLRHGRPQLVGYVVTRYAIDPNELLIRLGQVLPNYMIPRCLLPVAEMPLTANGKVDRKALAAFDAAGVTGTHINDPEQPISALEKTLLTIWQEVLRQDRISLHDNFFAIGGDSILSLQIAFKAREAGLSIEPRMLFDYPSISSLSTVVKPLQSAHEEQLPTVGDPVDLSPIQRWFFDHHRDDPHHFNQAFAFEVDPGLDPDILQAALVDVIAHHDALRLIFRQEHSEWRAQIAESPIGSVLECVEGLDTVEATVAHRQRMFDLGSGRLLHGVLAREGSRAVLVILAHHLVVDGVSWRILAEDLAQSYAQRLIGRPACLPRRTASYASWTRHLLSLAGAPALADEWSFWHRQLVETVASFPALPAGAENSYKKARKLHITCEPDFTEALLTRAPHAYRANTGDLLLAALSATLRDWLGDQHLLIDLESHGRNTPGDDPPDVSRTIGWFTAIYPLLIDAGVEDDYGKLVRQIKDKRCSVPNGGISYGLLRYVRGDTALKTMPEAQVCFNYLGRFDHAFLQPPLLRGVANIELGPRHAGVNTRPYYLEVDAFVHHDRLMVEWTFGSDLLGDAEVDKWMLIFQRHLYDTVQHCLSVSVPRYTVSDFCEVHLDNAAIDALQATGPDLQDVYPLSSTQEGMLFHSVSAPSSGIYFEQVVFRVRDDITPVMMQSAFVTLMQRHEILRTTFTTDIVGQPIQVVRAWSGVDWKALRVVDETAFSEWLAQDRLKGFDLDAAPPWRVAMVSTAEGNSWLVLSHHHILLDGWSVSLLIDEVQTLITNPDEHLPKLRRFREYVLKQRKQAGADQVYWQDRLAGVEEAASLPMARFNVNGPDSVARTAFDIQIDMNDRLKLFASRHGLTLATLVQAAWALLLYRYTGQRDCLFGVAVSGRVIDMPGIEAMLGLFIATLPTRVAVDADRPVLTWLHDIQNRHLEDEGHTGLSLAEVKNATGLNLDRPLFESLLVFENYPARGRAQPLFHFDRAHERTSFPLTVVLSPRHGLHGHIDYDLRYYDEATVRRLCSYFVSTLDKLADSADLSVGDLAALSEADRRWLIDAWRSDRPAALPATAHGLFELQAHLTPTAPALEYEGHSLTYQQLNEGADLMADLLRDQGIGPGDIVAIFLPRSVELVIAVLAVMKSGAAYLPIDAGYPLERVRMLLEDSRAALLLTISRLSAKWDETVPTWVLDGEQLVQPGLVPSSRSAGPQDLAYVIYTSGSTGKPKGVLIEHASLVNYLCDARERYQVRPGMRSALHSSISFDATITSLLVPLVAGAQVVVLSEDADVNSLTEYLVRETAPQLLKITPINLEILGASAPTAALARVKSLVVGGEALRDSALQSWRRAGSELRVFNEYGPTETVVGCCVFMFEVDSRFDGDVPIGRPIAGTDLFVLDQDLQPVPFGCTGELYIGGAGLARGYLGLPELTAEHFVTVPLDGDRRLYRTGDLVRALPDGNLLYEGRRDRQIKLRGYRIEPGEIEGQLLILQDIRQATVVVREQILVAYVATDPGTFDALQLRSYLANRLPRHMVPGVFMRLDAIPQTPNGKVDIEALPPPKVSVSSSGRRPSDQLETTLCAIWEEVLQRSHIGIDDHFFDLGGHSLTALRITARIARQLSVSIGLKTFFDRPSIAALADEIRRQRIAPDAERGLISVPIARRGKRISDSAVATRRRSDVDV